MTRLVSSGVYLSFKSFRDQRPVILPRSTHIYFLQSLDAVRRVTGGAPHPVKKPVPIIRMKILSRSNWMKRTEESQLTQSHLRENGR